MRVRLIAVGTRLPAWIGAGVSEYSRRMPPESPLELVEIPLARGTAHGARGRAVEREGERMLAALGSRAWVVALDVGGQRYDTAALARWWAGRLRDGRELALLVGGPDGLAPGCLARADERLSLSPLTLPHGLVRVLVAEQLYRVQALLKGHPYHRE